ncbi:hypothetical protein CFC21_075234, partial [Triticum aestivum]
MAPLKVTAALCVVLVLMIQLQAPAAAQDITCDECGPGCGQACNAQRPYFCNSFCNIFPHPVQLLLPHPIRLVCARVHKPLQDQLCV